MVAPFVVDVRLPGVLPPADLARVCAGLAARLRNGAVAAVVCHAESLAGELAAVEALARCRWSPAAPAPGSACGA
jgi:hypothetical protein